MLQVVNPHPYMERINANNTVNFSFDLKNGVINDPIFYLYNDNKDVVLKKEQIEVDTDDKFSFIPSETDVTTLKNKGFKNGADYSWKVVAYSGDDTPTKEYIAITSLSRGIVPYEKFDADDLAYIFSKGTKNSFLDSPSVFLEFPLSDCFYSQNDKIGFCEEERIKSLSMYTSYDDPSVWGYGEGEYFALCDSYLGGYSIWGSYKIEEEVTCNKSIVCYIINSISGDNNVSIYAKLKNYYRKSLKYRPYIDLDGVKQSESVVNSRNYECAVATGFDEVFPGDDIPNGSTKCFNTPFINSTYNRIWYNTYYFYNVDDNDFLTKVIPSTDSGDVHVLVDYNGEKYNTIKNCGLYKYDEWESYIKARAKKKYPNTGSQEAFIDIFKKLDRKLIWASLNESNNLTNLPYRTYEALTYTDDNKILRSCPAFVMTVFNDKNEPTVSTLKSLSKNTTVEFPFSTADDYLFGIQRIDKRTVSPNFPFALYKVFYSQSDGIALSHFKYCLYQQDSITGQFKLIKESPTIVNDNISDKTFTYNGFINGNTYKLMAYGQDENGFDVSTPEEIFTCRYNSTELDNTLKYDYSTGANVIDMTSMTLTNLRDDVYELNSKVFRYDKTDDVMELAGEITNVAERGYLYDNTFYDYNIKNRKEYSYVINANRVTISNLTYSTNSNASTPGSNTVQDNLAEYLRNPSTLPDVSCGDDDEIVIEIDDFVNNEAKINLTHTVKIVTTEGEEEKVVTEKIGTLTKKNEMYSTNSVTLDFCNFSVLGVEDAGDEYRINDMFNFGMFTNPEQGEITINIQNDYASGLNKYDKEVRGAKGNLSGRLTGLLDGERTLDEWIDFVNNDDTKVLREFSGRTMIISIDSASVNPRYLADKNLYEVTFSYRELGSTDEMKLYDTTQK